MSGRQICHRLSAIALDLVKAEDSARNGQVLALLERLHGRLVAQGRPSATSA